MLSAIVRFSLRFRGIVGWNIKIRLWIAPAGVIEPTKVVSGVRTPLAAGAFVPPNGRKLVECQMNLDLYAQSLAGVLNEVVNPEGRQ